MGKMPLLGLAGLCLSGAILCGCQDSRHCRNGSCGPRATQPLSGTASGAAAPTGGTASTGWDNTPSRNLTSRPTGSSDPLGRTGTSPGLTDPGTSTRQPFAGAPTVPAGGTPSFDSGAGRGFGQSGNTGLSGSAGRALDPMPSPPGTPTPLAGPGLGAPAQSPPTNNLLAPPGLPSGVSKPVPSAFNPPADPATSGLNQAKMDGNYRLSVPSSPGTATPQPSLGAAPAPLPSFSAPPPPSPVPTMPAGKPLEP